MPYLRFKRTWAIQMKTMHHVHLHVTEGFFNDRIRLYVDDYLAVDRQAGVTTGMTGYELFTIDGRELVLCWAWHWLTGNPLSIVILHKDRILARYGTDRAAQDDILGA